MVDKELDREVEKIIDHTCELVVKWRGFPEYEATQEKNVTLWQFEERMKEHLCSPLMGVWTFQPHRSWEQATAFFAL